MAWVLSLILATAIFSSASASASAAGVGSPARQPCYATAHGAMIALLCFGGPRSPGRDCCSSLLQAAEKGGLRCLCDAAASPDLLTSGFTASDLLHWYQDCGGRRAINFTDLVSSCLDLVGPAYSESNVLPVLTSSSQATPPPPPPTPTTSAQSVVVIVPVQHHHAIWPWIILALGVLTFTALMTWICCLGCERIISLITQLGMWLFNLGQSSGDEGAASTAAGEGANSVPTVNVIDQPNPDLPLIVLHDETAVGKATHRVYY